MSSKIIVIFKDRLGLASQLQKHSINDDFVSLIINSPRIEHPVNVVIYKNQGSNMLHFTDSEGNKVDRPDGTNNFYFDELYKYLANHDAEIKVDGI